MSPFRDLALPVEVKSGADFRRHKALDNVLAVGEWGIDRSIVLCPSFAWGAGSAASSGRGVGRPGAGRVSRMA